MQPGVLVLSARAPYVAAFLHLNKTQRSPEIGVTCRSSTTTGVRRVNDERPTSSSQRPSDVGGHPKGTLVILGVYGLLFALGWLILYFLVFLPRGALTQ